MGHLRNVFLSQTYSIDKKVPDAAATGTALFTGVKTRNEIIGLDSRVRKGDCMGSLSASARVSSIMQWAQDAGKHTGNLYIGNLYSTFL